MSVKDLEQSAGVRHKSDDNDTGDKDSESDVQVTNPKYSIRIRLRGTT